MGRTEERSQEITGPSRRACRGINDRALAHASTTRRFEHYGSSTLDGIASITLRICIHYHRPVVGNRAGSSSTTFVAVWKYPSDVTVSCTMLLRKLVRPGSEQTFANLDFALLDTMLSRHSQMKYLSGHDTLYYFHPKLQTCMMVTTKNELELVCVSHNEASPLEPIMLWSCAPSERQGLIEGLLTNAIEHVHADK